MNHPEYIVLHHSATKDTESVSWGAIRTYHVETNGWRDVGYHFGIELVGTYYEILAGRFPTETGAHCPNAGMNRHSIGICCVGNYDEVEPSVDMLSRLRKLVEWVMIEYDIPANNIIGHRDAGLMDGYDWQEGQFKTCPGKLFPLNEFRSQFS